MMQSKLPKMLWQTKEKRNKAKVISQMAKVISFEEAKKSNVFYEAENTIEYIIQKNRDGGTDSVLLHCEPAFNLIKDL